MKSSTSTSRNPPKQNSLISTQDAIYMLSRKITDIDIKLTKTISVLEAKLGNYENTMTEGKIDNENINILFSNMNTRLLDLESLNERIIALETNANIKPATSTKKKSVKLNELTDTPSISVSTSVPTSVSTSVPTSVSPGISFT